MSTKTIEKFELLIAMNQEQMIKEFLKLLPDSKINSKSKPIISVCGKVEFDFDNEEINLTLENQD